MPTLPWSVCGLVEHSAKYCDCIVTRGGVYDEILPEPKGFPEGSGNFSLYTRLETRYSHSQLPLLANILIKELAFLVILI